MLCLCYCNCCFSQSTRGSLHCFAICLSSGHVQMSTTSEFEDEETEEEVVELSEGDLLQLLDSQEPALQVGLWAERQVVDSFSLCIWIVDAGLRQDIHSQLSSGLRSTQASQSESSIRPEKHRVIGLVCADLGCFVALAKIDTI